LSEIM